MDKGKTAILLATYNSQRFLVSQIESIINQTYQDWTLYIRDDGSKDNTIEIISSFINTDTRIVLIEDKFRNLGAGGSFMALLKQVDADNYLFCDHDDVWLSEKIERSLKEMQRLSEMNPGKPIIVHSDLYVVDQDLNVIDNSFWKSSGIKPAILNKKNIIQVFNCVTGCTMLFNQAAKKCSLPYNLKAPMHDWWIAIKTLKNGGIIFGISEPLIYYRQHESNEVGARDVNTQYFVNKILSIKNTFRGQFDQIKFLKSANGIGIFRYYYYKILYTLIRKI